MVTEAEQEDEEVLQDREQKDQDKEKDVRTATETNVLQGVRLREKEDHTGIDQLLLGQDLAVQDVMRHGQREALVIQ